MGCRALTDSPLFSLGLLRAKRPEIQESVVRTHGRQLSAHKLPVPVHERAVPGHEEAVPSHEEAVPAHEEALPEHEESGPTHGKAVPLHKGPVPSYEEAVPKNGSAKMAHEQATHGFEARFHGIQPVQEVLGMQFQPIGACIHRLEPASHGLEQQNYPLRVDGCAGGAEAKRNNPNGITTSSPRLARQRLPWGIVQTNHQPQRGCGECRVVDGRVWPQPRCGWK
jgi:hypothetical protein